MLTACYSGSLYREWTHFYQQSRQALKAGGLATFYFIKLAYLLLDGALGLFLRGPGLIKHLAPNLPPEAMPDGRHRLHGQGMPF